jgi:hypothetical protein
LNSLLLPRFALLYSKGSLSDAVVLEYVPYIARMLHADIDKLWKAGFGVADSVRVYGSWKG